MASLRYRALRFADLRTSEVFGGDLTASDLRYARLLWCRPTLSVTYFTTPISADLGPANISSSPGPLSQVRT